ncbi:MAG TPA: hydantoinase B/oxoprolinase family protein [Pirellulaceae bacterium]|nr:hydantoinase B/oxoprolinase family protein [Pirellulaceae bacterium]
MNSDRWQFWLDVGGTFTDCLARRPDGTLLRRKVLSSATVKGRAANGSTRQVIINPARGSEPANFWAGYTLRLLDASGAVLDAAIVTSSDRRLVLDRPLKTTPVSGQSLELASPEDAPILAIRQFLALKLDEPIPPCAVRLGTTKGTNALLTRRGARCALVTTRGFGDILSIGYQNRPRLFDLAIKKPAPLFETAIEVQERIARDGSVLAPLDEDDARRQLAVLRAAGIESLAICVMNSYVNPAHEQQLEALARQVGFTEISLASRAAPLMKIVPRGDTTVVDAYLNPLLRQYVERLRLALPGSDVRLMTSSGGLVSGETFTGKDSILSGPAGGVVGFSRAAQAAGFAKAIGFDMGGTSTDVARFDGRFEYEQETEKAGVRIVAPMLAIETVAAGGGSICRFDGVKLTVGPASAGADPGPACYGRGGPLTVTDCNLFLGRLIEEHFPFALSRSAVEQRLAEIALEVAAAGNPLSAIELAEGFLAIANANMAQAIRSISLAKGYQPADYVLVAFGSAGPQHACAVARQLGIRQVLIHPDAGVLSALGIGVADVVRHEVAGIYEPLSPESLARLKSKFDELAAAAVGQVEGEGVPRERTQVRRSLDLRYRGVDAFITVAEPADGGYAAAFSAEHQRLYGYLHEGRPLEIVAARVEAVGNVGQVFNLSSHSLDERPRPRGRESISADDCPTGNKDRPKSTPDPLWPVFRRDDLPAGTSLVGSALIVEPLTTTVIDAGWRGEMLTGGELLLTDDAGFASTAAAATTDADPIQLELFNGRFTAIATQMGITLKNTAGSVNVKERLDFSCAIFTADGDLVVNAPHIPVHLGAMSQTVKQILADNPQMQPGDVFVTNDPYRGGSHLPDVTVVTPVFESGPLAPRVDGTRSVPTTCLRFFVASRAHHAEIGGITPGSMPPFSKNLAEEGVLLANFKLADAEKLRLDELRQALLDGPYPTRAVEDNLADITAQMAANHQGVRDLSAFVAEQTWPVVEAYMRHVQDAAERKMRAALAKLPPGRREFVDHLDDGTPIAVAVTVEGDGATIDFTGTGPVLAGNLNANRAIVTAAVMYCLRLLVGEDIPLNQGLLKPVQIVLPECLLNPPLRERPEDCAAIACGNVETSQRVVDVLLGAFDLAAASQGTMNNLLFGDATFGYYETICGGSGATAQADGADAVHTHMTNTRLTDPEVLERRFPVRLLEFSIRRGSGGRGEHRGGDGALRRIEFLKELTVSILSQRRGPYPPYGLYGGEPGSLGQNSLRRADGRVEQLPALAQFTVRPGDVLTIETPGGGGWKKPATE